MVDPDKPLETRKFCVVGTGWDVEGRACYIATVHEGHIMNERIKELIEQATESKGFLTAGDNVPPLPVKEFNKEKFAELIVKECAEVAETWYDDYPKDDRSVTEAVKEHFGVEE